MVLQTVLGIVLIIAMTWIVLSPTATDEAAKAALVVVSSGMGFVLGKATD